MPPWLTMLNWHWTELPAVLLLVTAAAGIGLLILRAADVSRHHPGNALPAVVIGLDLLMVVGVLAGLERLNPPPLLHWLLLLTGTIIAGIVYRKSHPLLQLRQLKPGALWLPGILILFTLAPACCPPVGWDELTYHLTLPLRWNRDGALQVYADLPYSAFPAGPEILFRHLIAIGGLHTPRLLTWVLNGLLLLWIYRYLATRLPRLGAGLLALALTAMPVWLMLQREAFVEIFILLNVMVLITLATENDYDFQNWKTWLVPGIVIGGCAAVKLYGIAAAVAALLPLLINRSIRKNRWGLPLAAITALLVALPFYLRPWLATGNPFYPYYAGLLGGNRLDLMVSDWHHAAAAQQYGQFGWYGLLEAIFLLSAPDRWFDGSFGWQWPLLLTAAVIAVWGARRNTIGWVLGGLLYYCCWYFFMPQARFLLPLPLLLLPVWRELPPNLCKRLLPLLLLSALTLWSIPGNAWKHYLNCWRYLTTAQIKPADFIYSATGPGYLPAVEMCYRLVPVGARNVLLFDHRTAYFPAGTEMGTPFVQRQHFTPPPTDAVALLRRCREQQVAYLTVILSPHHPDRVPQYFIPALVIVNQLEELCAQRKATKLWSGDGATLYHIQ